MRLLALLGLGLLVGCAGSSRQTTSERYTRVDSLGHMCFQITNSLGTKILTNPYAPGSTGHRAPRGLRPHILLISHERSDANYVNITEADPRIFRGLVAAGPNTASGLTINGLPVASVPGSTDPAGLNILFSWQQDGMRFCFPGNLPRGLTSEEISRIGPVDILFLPIDQPGSLSDAARHELVERLRPKLVIPMAGRRSSIERWSSSYQDVMHLPGRSFLISRQTLPSQPFPRIVLLE